MVHPTTQPEDSGGSAAQPRSGASWDAESGNTASHKCNGETKNAIPFFQVLWQGVDSLELSFAGFTEPTQEAELKRLKAAAQSSAPEDRATAQWQSGDRIFEVLDRGSRFFAYALRHPDMRIMVASGNSKRGVFATVAFGNEFLVSVGPEQAAKEAGAVVRVFGLVGDLVSVSRVDLTVDIYTHEDMGQWPRQAWVTRAEKTGAYTVNGQFSGWTIGQGSDVSMRIYDKTLEMTSVKEKPYFKQLWTDAGWFPADAVMRVEIQLRRGALKEFGIASVSDMLKARPKLWAYATQEWTRLALPSEGDETRSRWASHPFWAAVQAVAWEGEPGRLARRRKVNLGPTDAQLVRYFKAVVTGAMARDRLPTIDEAIQRLRELLEEHLEYVRIHDVSGADIETIIALKRRQYCSAFNK